VVRTLGGGHGAEGNWILALQCFEEFSQFISGAIVVLGDGEL
jgi:hypothetical protein